MNIDIRGIWKYKAMRETCEGLRDAVTAQAAAREAAIAAKNAVIEQKDREAKLTKAKISQLRKERDDARKIIDTATERFFCEKDKLKKKHAEEVKNLEAEAEEQHRSYESLEEYCKMLEDDAKKLKEKIKDLEAENAELKKTRYRWVDHRHGWWPVESGDLDDLVMKVPYVVYTMQKREQEDQEEQEEKRIPEV
jgi:chromosome segregation ATPase